MRYVIDVFDTIDTGCNALQSHGHLSRREREREQNITRRQEAQARAERLKQLRPDIPRIQDVKLLTEKQALILGDYTDYRVMAQDLDRRAKMQEVAEVRSEGGFRERPNKPTDGDTESNSAEDSINGEVSARFDGGPRTV